jgi:hypothetical protein
MKHKKALVLIAKNQTFRRLRSGGIAVQFNIEAYDLKDELVYNAEYSREAAFVSGIGSADAEIEAVVAQASPKYASIQILPSMLVPDRRRANGFSHGVHIRARVIKPSKEVASDSLLSLQGFADRCLAEADRNQNQGGIEL